MPPAVAGATTTASPADARWSDGPIVDDNVAPFDTLLSPLTVDDLIATPLSEWYRRSCATTGAKPNRCILDQLPSTSANFPHLHLMILNATGAYLGNRGAAALIPIVAACPRLTHLLLPRVGMKADVAKALIAVLAVHPGITHINLSNNHLGTAVGKLLVALVRDHRRIHALDVHETLLIPPIKRRIDVHLSSNAAIKDQFTVPLIPTTAEDNEIIAAGRIREAEEAARHQRAAALLREQEDALPDWAPAAIAELRVALRKHHRNLVNVYSVFAPWDKEDPAVAKASQLLRCTAQNFQRGLKILGIQSLTAKSPQAEEQCRVFAELFHAYDATHGVIRVGDIIAVLRPHALLRLTASTADSADAASSSTTLSVTWRPDALETQRALDCLFDVRHVVVQALEAADLDMTLDARVSEVANGIASVTRQAEATVDIVANYMTLLQETHEQQQQHLGEDRVLLKSKFVVIRGSSTHRSDRISTPAVGQASSRGIDDADTIIVDAEADIMLKYHRFVDAIQIDATSGRETGDDDTVLKQVAEEQDKLHGLKRSTLFHAFR